MKILPESSGVRYSDLSTKELLRALGVRLALLFLVSTPLVVYGIDLAGVSIRISRVFLLAIAPICVMLVAIDPKRLQRDIFFKFLVLPYFVFASSSLLWVDNVPAAIERLSGLLEVCIAYVALVMLCVSPQIFQQFIKAYMWGAAICIGISVWQFTNVLIGFSEAEVPFAGALIPHRYERLENFGAFPSEDGFSRISASFGEPNMFAGYLSSVILISLLARANTSATNFFLMCFRVLLVACLVLTISKSGAISLLVGLATVGILLPQIRPLFISMLGIATCLLVLLNMLGYSDVVNRFISTTGHLEFMEDVLKSMSEINLLRGEGIGSYEFGSTHRFLLTRVYELGLVGAIFVALVTVTPCALWIKVATDSSSELAVKPVLVGCCFSIVVGLHLYDYFIHLFTWIVAGLTAATFLMRTPYSSYYHTTTTLSGKAHTAPPLLR